MIEKPIKYYSLEFADVDIFEKYMHVTPKEVNMDVSKMEALLNIANENFSSSFGYIGDRKNKNSIEPVSAAFLIEKAVNLKAIAVVTYSTISEKMVEIEKSFISNIPGLNIQVPIETFEDLDSAVKWIETTVSHNETG